MVAVVALALLTGFAGVAWFGRTGSSQTVAHCPARSAPDAPRTHRIVSLLRSHEDGQAIQRGVGRDPAICYGEFAHGVVHSDGAFLLSRDQDDRVNAARLAHLMLHRIEGLTLDDSAIEHSTLPCGDLVQGVMQRERDAHALEARFREAFGLGPAIDTLQQLQSAYTTRCQRLRGHTDDTNAASTP